jgi:hypothetical protein
MTWMGAFLGHVHRGFRDSRTRRPRCGSGDGKRELIATLPWPRLSGYCIRMHFTVPP